MEYGKGTEIMQLITPTNFIYQAAQKTPVIQLPMNKQVIYTFEDYPEVKDKYCFLCGGETGFHGTARKKTIKETFTDISGSRYLTSQSCCPGCSFCLSSSSLRNYSIFATENYLKHPARPELKEIVLDPPAIPFILCIAKSGQRWLHYNSKVNYSSEIFTIRFEDLNITVNRAKFKELIDIIERLYVIFSKEEILTGRYSTERIKRFGIDRFYQLSDHLNNLKQKEYRVFELSVFLAQKKE